MVVTRIDAFGGSIASRRCRGRPCAAHRAGKASCWHDLGRGVVARADAGLRYSPRRALVILLHRLGGDQRVILLIDQQAQQVSTLSSTFQLPSEAAVTRMSGMTVWTSA